MRNSIACLLGILFFASCGTKDKKRVLPIVGNYDIAYDTINGKEVQDTIYPKIPCFSFLNEDSLRVTSKNLKGKIWIANFFFTSCPTICPTMTSQMKRLNKMTNDINQYLQYISFSIDPITDQPYRLQQYIHKFGIQTNNWTFLTGNEAKTHALGVDYFQVFANKDIESAGGYAHSPAFVLVDREGYVRGVYIGTETSEVNKMEKDIRKLLTYEYNISC